MFEVLWLHPCSGERFEKFAKLNRIVTMISNAYALGRSQNRAPAIEFSGVKAHAHIGDESAKHEHEVGRLDVSPNLFVTAHRAAIDADVEGMVFGNCAFA